MHLSPDRDHLITEQRRARLRAYQREADPLFFAWQAGEASREDWLAQRAAIRARYPYPAPQSVPAPPASTAETPADLLSAPPTGPPADRLDDAP